MAPSADNLTFLIIYTLYVYVCMSLVYRWCATAMPFINKHIWRIYSKHTSIHTKI